MTDISYHKILLDYSSWEDATKCRALLDAATFEGIADKQSKHLGTSFEANTSVLNSTRSEFMEIETANVLSTSASVHYNHPIVRSIEENCEKRTILRPGEDPRGYWKKIDPRRLYQGAGTVNFNQ